MSNPKHVQLEPVDAVVLVNVLEEMEEHTPQYFHLRGLSLQLMRLKREIRRIHAQYEKEDKE